MLLVTISQKRGKMDIIYKHHVVGVNVWLGWGLNISMSVNRHFCEI